MLTNINTLKDTLSTFNEAQYENVTYMPPNNYGSYLGSCPNHLGVYQNLNQFKIENTINALEIINEIENNLRIYS